MKYQWLEETKTCEGLSQELGCKVKSITKGNITIGYEDAIDQDGNPYQQEITRKGIEIEFEKEPDAQTLEKLDRLFTSYKRKGGKTIADEIDELKATVQDHEKRLKKDIGGHTR